MIKMINVNRKNVWLLILSAIFTITLSIAISLFSNAFIASAQPILGILGANVSLQSDIIIKFHTDATTGDGTKLSVDFNGKTTEITSNIDGVFAFSGVTPQSFNDEMTATLYAADGTTQIGESKKYSVQDYLENLLLLDFEMSGCATEMQYKAMQRLAVDMLNYGSAAQIYLSEDTQKLANKNLTSEQKALATETITNVESDEVVNGDAWVGAGIRFDSRLGLFFVFKAESLDGIVATVNDVVITPEEYAVAGLTDKCWAIRYNDFNAVNMNDVITAKLTFADATEQTFAYSIASYVASMGTPEQGASQKQINLANLVNATYAYGYSAVAYQADYIVMKDATFDAEGSLVMDGKGYDFTDYEYYTIALPKVSAKDYIVSHVERISPNNNVSLQQVKNKYTSKEYPTYSTTITSQGCLLVGDTTMIYSRYDVELLNSDDVEVTWDDAATGFIFKAKNPVTINGYLMTRGASLTILGDVTLNYSSSYTNVNTLIIGSETEEANVVLNYNGDKALNLSNGSDLTVAKKGNFKINGNGSYGIFGETNGSMVLVDGNLTVADSIRIEGAATWVSGYDYGVHPCLYVRGGTCTIEDGHLMTNSLQVGSLKTGQKGTLTVSQTAKYAHYYGEGSTKAENTICAERWQAVRWYFANGELNLNNKSGVSMTCLDPRTAKSCAIMIGEGMTVNTTGVYSYFVGAWSDGYTYDLSVHSDAKFNLSNSANFYNIGVNTDINCTYLIYSSATINIDGVDKEVYFTFTQASGKKPTIPITTLVDNGEGSKSFTDRVLVDGAYTTASGTVGYELVFTKATYVDASGTTHTIYYKVR